MEYGRYDNQVVLRLDKGDEIIACITDLFQREGLQAAAVQGIGYTDNMRLRIYDRDRDTFLFQTVTDPMEITSLTGNVVMADNGLYPHLHVMAAGPDLKVIGGHLSSCVIALTGELVLTLLPGKVRREAAGDEKIGLMRFEP